MEMHRVSVGIAASAGEDVARAIAPVLERAGLRALWVNETPGANALDVAAAAAAATSRLAVATGVIPVDRRPPTDVLADLARLDIPRDRLVLGIGSGGARGAGVLALMRDAVGRLRADAGSAVAVGALGPRMRRLAAEEADGVVLNWLTPGAAREQTDAHHARSRAAGRDGGRVALYVRTAFDEAALGRLEAEAARYGSYPAYAANFERLGFGPADTVIRPGALRARLAQYLAAVDEVVLRAIVPGDDAGDYVRFAEGVAEAVR